jgi:hypothetical protein
MKFKGDVIIETSDFWYDLTEGYIKPKCLLENSEDILAVEKAKNLLMEFKKQAEIQGILEEI